ncbi:unnamed protein product, partial [Brassica rapa]
AFETWIKHERSGDCDPRKRKKPVCPVKRCSESLTSANNLTCKDSGVKFCLKHESYVCNKKTFANSETSSRWNDMCMEVLRMRKEKGCGRGTTSVSSNSPPSTRSF